VFRRLQLFANEPRLDFFESRGLPCNLLYVAPTVKALSL
jgi:hypothetical protein